MRIGERLLSTRWAQDLARFFNTRSARGPSGELREVPQARQGRVTQAVVRGLEAQYAGKLSGPRAVAVKELLAHVGQPDFYTVLARHDRANAAKWAQMADVQRQFAKVEPSYDAKTRAYSESMRLTLHASVVQHVADAGVTSALYERFIELHPTAFHENGGWFDNLHIPLTGALAVARATPPEMWLNAKDLVDGACLTDPRTVRAAQLVRASRRQALSGWL